MIKTKFTEMFGIEKPIVQGGMQHLGIAEFASLVCNAGGMGTINITCYPGVDEFHEDVIKMKEFTNNKPFIVNISLVPDLTKGEEIFKYIDVCAKEGVAAIEFAGASPVEFMPACKEAGIKIIHKSPNAKVAASMARKGADVITIAGYEVAGHPSMDGIGTFVIANKAAKVCAEYGVPVLAAGGVADGKGLAAALALGAQGVVLGTRLQQPRSARSLITTRNGCQSIQEKDTVIIQKSIHNAARVANNMAAKLTLEMEKRGTTLEELMTVIAGRLSKKCYKNGDIDGGIYALGPAMGLIDDIKPVQQLMDDMVARSRRGDRRIKGFYLLMIKGIEEKAINTEGTKNNKWQTRQNYKTFGRG